MPGLLVEPLSTTVAWGELAATVICVTAANNRSVRTPLLSPFFAIGQAAFSLIFFNPPVRPNFPEPASILRALGKIPRPNIRSVRPAPLSGSASCRTSRRPLPGGFGQGFLSLRASDGKLLASGDLTQIAHGNRVVFHVVFRFKDGSLDDETAIFCQQGAFQLLTDRHIQKGPAFPKPSDIFVNVSTGNVTIRSKDKGRRKVDTTHIDLPSDLANGVILDILKNIPATTTKETKLSYLAATPKPRLVKLTITPQPEETFSVAGARHQATRFEIKIDLGGIAGIIAPLIGKQPADISVWIAGGEVPAFVKSVGPLYVGGPIWTIQMTSPVWPRASK